MTSLLLSIASVIGAFYLLKIFLTGLKSLLAHISAFLGSGLDFKKLGKWAVVTGATDGIGKQYALQLAAKGLNIVLISRTKSKLEAVSKEILEKYPVETKEIVADFTQSDIYEDIQKQLEDLDIGVLVNNVGVSYDFPQYLEQISQPLEFVRNVVNVNMLSATGMTTSVLGGMKQRKRGIIINLSSLSAFSPTPLLTLYGAAKNFIVSFSEDLEIECLKSGVMVQCVVPGYVATNMSKIKKTSLFVPSPKTYVKSALAMAGRCNVSAAYWPHCLFMSVLTVVQWLAPSLVYGKYALSMMDAIRQKKLRRIAQEEKKE